MHSEPFGAALGNIELKPAEKGLDSIGWRKSITAKKSFKTE